ncbi:MAG: type I phosphomannose isomerase catalytic subunit, partial [Lachnospiraceae bacterium]
MTMLKLRPSYKDYLWGGKKLVSDFNKEYNGDILAESWELSCHPEGPSYIANGEYEGETITEYLL